MKQAATLQNAVYDGCGEVLVVQDGSKLSRVFVGREGHRAASQVSLVDDVEEHVGGIGAVGEGADFEDAIAVYNFAMDVHAPQGKEESHGWTLVSRPYDIPYRVLLPKEVENLLACGRCISVDKDAHGSTRAMPCCMATGEAAGTAAAIAVKDGRSVRDLDIRKLRTALVRQGAYLR